MSDTTRRASAKGKKVTRKVRKTKSGKKAKKASSGKKTTRKTKAKPKKPVVKHTDEEGLLCLSKDDLLRYELAQHKVLNDAQAIKLRQGEMGQVQIEASQKMDRLKSEVSTLAVARKEHAEELKSLQDEIGEAYQIDMSQVSYDDVTGRIYLNGDPVPTG